MRILLLFSWLSFCALGLSAPAEELKVKLAIISGSPEALAAADVLTAEFTKNDKVQLLERAEIERVYREQGLAAANRDYLELGQILGADGLLLMGLVNEGTNQFLSVRLIAVKPGVVLAAENLSWPMTDTMEWAPLFAKHLDLYLPKLSVLVKDAIPISVVNLRSATQSDEAQETERLLKLLTIQRLTQEPQFFVLERQQLQLLSEEKVLKSDESAFWNGSYLVEGVIDQNGYSKDTVTISAKLTPPKGAGPSLFEVSGCRTNLPEVVNRLAVKVAEVLKINSATKEWNASDEAEQYFNEARWALKWGMYSEGQMAAESAWALGKRNMDCASVRIQTYLCQIPMLGGANATLHAYGRTYAHVTGINELPDPKDCDLALNTLKCYYAFCEGNPEIVSRSEVWNPWADSDWYQVGIASLDAASQVLKHFYAHPESQEAVADKLSELRRTTRMVADFISQSRTVHDSYFVGDRAALHDELSHAIGESRNVFRCEAESGCFWQDRPEDGVKLYRELMSSPVFCYIHQNFWHREAMQPRLVAWNDADRKRIRAMWANFVRELDQSTNVFWQLEAKALQLADADGETQMAESFTNLFDAFFEDRDVLISNNVDVLYREWQLGDLVWHMGGIAASREKDSLQDIYQFKYLPRIDAMEQEYLNRTGPAAQTTSAFEKQKQYLADFTPFDLAAFNKVFWWKVYTKAQAAELKPLIEAYKSDLMARASSVEKFKAQGNAGMVEILLERSVDEILDAAAPASLPVAQNRPRPVLASPPELVANILRVTKFLPIPLDGLPGDEISAVTIVAHHWLEGKLMLNFQYDALVYALNERRKDRNGARQAILPAIAILDPAMEHWEVISCPEADAWTHNRFYHHTTLLHGELFNSDGGQIRKYDFKRSQWEVLPSSNGDNYELFNVNDHLYAANANVIFEIMDGGKSTRLLASSRRQPPASVLDKEDLGAPTLFSGPENSLRVKTWKKIFTWTGGDWREDVTAPPSMFPPAVFPEGVLLLYPSRGYLGSDSRSHPLAASVPVDSLCFLTGATPELCFGPKARSNNFRMAPEPVWKLPPQMSLENLAVTLCRSNLYLLAGHSEVQMASDPYGILTEKVVASGGYNAVLWCFSRNSPQPQKTYLNFDAPNGFPPLAGISPDSYRSPGQPQALMVFAGNNLLFAPESPISSVPNSFLRTAVGYKTGVWLAPMDRLAPVIAPHPVQIIHYK